MKITDAEAHRLQNELDLAMDDVRAGNPIKAISRLMVVRADIPCTCGEERVGKRPMR